MIECRAGSFSTGTGAIGTTVDIVPTPSIVINGTSVIFFFFNGRTDVVDANGRATRWRGAGCAVSATKRWAQCSQDQDAVAAHAGGSYSSNAACLVSIPAGIAADGLIDFDSWLSNGARLIVDDAMPLSYRVGYLLVTGLTNADVGQWIDLGTTGNKVITSSLSFKPDAEFLLASNIDGAPPSGRGGNEMQGLGFIASSSVTQQATWAGGSDEGSATTDSDSYSNDVECLSAITAGAGSILSARWTFVSQDTNGFTLNQVLVPATLAYNFFTAMQGGAFRVVSVLTQTDTSTQIVTPALGMRPEGAILLSAFKAEHVAGTCTVHDTSSIGVVDRAGNRFACAIRSTDGVADTVVFTAIEHDECYIGISATPALESLMDIVSFNEDTITFIMDDADPSQKFVTMLVFGNQIVGKDNTTNQSVNRASTY